MANRSVSVAALLAVVAAAAVFQATSAYVVPEGKSSINLKRLIGA
jgi:hypothetical protein